MTCGNSMVYYNGSPLFDLMFKDLCCEPSRKSRSFVHEPRYRWTTEKDGTIVGEVELPGVAKEGINLDFKDNKLLLTAIRRRRVSDTEVGKDDDKNAVLPGEVEKTTEKTEEAKPKNEENLDDIARKYEVRFTLPDVMDVENIKAKYSHGILSLSIPRKPESQPRHISIEQ